jgi:nitroreductase
MTENAKLSTEGSPVKAVPTSPFLDLVRARRSVRRYLPRPVERGKIRACLEAARFAPSAHNVQPWRFLVVDDPALKERLCDGAFSWPYALSGFAAKAPVIVVILARKDVIADRLGSQVQGTRYHLLDIGIAGEHFVLEAEELGLGTCWIGWFNKRKTRKILKIPRKYDIVALLSLGHVEKKPSRERKLKGPGEIAWFNRVGGEEGEGIAWTPES